MSFIRSFTKNIFQTLWHSHHTVHDLRSKTSCSYIVNSINRCCFYTLYNAHAMEEKRWVNKKMLFSAMSYYVSLGFYAFTSILLSWPNNNQHRLTLFPIKLNNSPPNSLPSTPLQKPSQSKPKKFESLKDQATLIIITRFAFLLITPSLKRK